MTTVHSAKGLEFKNVFVVGLEENLFPSGRIYDNPRELEEERRLFYVAVTRAEENLTLSFAKNRFLNGTPTDCRPSRFIKDIDPCYLQLPSSFASERTFAAERTFDLPTNRHCGLDPQPPDNQTAIDRESRFKRGMTPLASTAAVTQHQSIGKLKIGLEVRHERFGKGTIAELLGDGDDAKAIVEFDDNGRKQLLLKFAKFQVV
jgi:DNA helicase-2/ATP-dependent DNA helicase PcrA